MCFTCSVHMPQSLTVFLVNYKRSRKQQLLLMSDTGKSFLYSVCMWNKCCSMQRLRNEQRIFSSGLCECALFIHLCNPFILSVRFWMSCVPSVFVTGWQWEPIRIWSVTTCFPRETCCFRLDWLMMFRGNEGEELLLVWDFFFFFFLHNKTLACLLNCERKCSAAAGW